MHFAQLQNQMTRYHENIRPRFANPTYVSSNVGTSLGTTIFRSQSTNSFQPQKINLASSAVMQKQINRKQIGLNTQNLSLQNNRKNESLGRSRKSSSNLSNYGSNSLGSMKRLINDKQIYEKQQKKYNIVTIQPKQYVDSIKIFPKYRLQNSDQNYYKKVILENQISSTRKKLNIQTGLKNHSDVIDKKLSINPQSPIKNNIPMKPFRGKLLNNIDQLTGVL